MCSKIQSFAVRAWTIWRNASRKHWNLNTRPLPSNQVIQHLRHNPLHQHDG